MSIETARLHRVTSWTDLDIFWNWLCSRRPVLAIDTETTGLEWWTPGFLRTVQFGDGEQAWVLSARRWLGVIEDAIAAYDRPIVMHNAKFDMHALESAGIHLPPTHLIHDTKILDHLEDPLQNHSLKAISERYWPGANRGQTLLHQRMRENRWTWATIPEDAVEYWAYAGLDAVLTAAVYEKLEGHLHEGAYDREISAQHVLYRAECRGLRIDVNYTENLGFEWETEMQALAVQLETYGVTNPNAARQIAEALRVTEGWNPEQWTPTGEPAMAEKILRRLDSEIAPLVLRYRRLRKWTSAYLNTFLTSKDANDFVHPSINTMQARTGRMSITGPALQTLPKGSQIRDCVLPSDEDHRLLAVDYDGQELRVFASYAAEDSLIRFFAADTTGKPDPHRYAASVVYGIPESDVTKAQRDITKGTQYGLIYGAGPAKIAETAGVEEAAARAFIAEYERRFPRVRPFMQHSEAVGRERLEREGEAYLWSWGGRKLKAEDDKLYTLINYLVQGSCADLLKQKIVDLDSAGYGDLIALPVHDELLFDLPAEDFDELRDGIVKIMHEEDAFAVPLTVHPSGPLTRWGDVAR